ncbi:MAG: PTS sugar transporter subunit IIB [Oscillospiraceae bacterium]|nr:PTS sugar transporter subunit IIB [Oscillospiraceae bacterium]
MAKMDNKKFMVCCANGAGSSLMMKMTLQKVLTKLDIKPATIHHCSLSEGKTASQNYDVVLCARNFANMFDDAKKKGTVVIGLKNIMSAPEMEQAMKDADLLD